MARPSLRKGWIPMIVLLLAGVVATTEVKALGGGSMYPSGDVDGATAGPASQPRRPWSAIRNWVAWLDGPKLDDIGRSSFELAVIDYSADGTASGEFTANQVEVLRHSGCERRVLAYLSIGEAEDYRFYWQKAWRPGEPAWIVSENPDWPGNYLVRYWDPAWQQLIYRYLDRIVAAGFDGIYLDRVDAYADPHAEGHQQAMVDFVMAIARRGRSLSPLGEDFAVVVQNAEELVESHPSLQAALTGMAREETYVVATNRPTSADDRLDVERNLDAIRRNSRSGLVLTIDYADKPPLVDEAYSRAIERGYVPYVAGVDLDRMRLNSGHEPVCNPISRGSLDLAPLARLQGTRPPP